MHLFIMGSEEFPWQEALAWVVIAMFSICVHELAHALAALRCGDDTAAKSGHLSLNPLVQMGPISLVVLVVFGIAWGAVPVDVHRLRKTWHAAAVAAAGPAANLLLCILAALLAVLCGQGDPEGPMAMVGKFFLIACEANGVLFFFNLLPAPMFDGWTVCSLFFPAMQRIDPEQARTFGWIFLLVVFVTPVGGMIWRAGSVISISFITGWQGMLAMVGLG